jgi:hypothetical protein
VLATFHDPSAQTQKSAFVVNLSRSEIHSAFVALGLEHKAFQSSRVASTFQTEIFSCLPKTAFNEKEKRKKTFYSFFIDVNEQTCKRKRNTQVKL